MKYKFEPINPNTDYVQSAFICPCCGALITLRHIPQEEVADPNQLSFDFDEVENV